MAEVLGRLQNQQRNRSVRKRRLWIKNHKLLPSFNACLDLVNTNVGSDQAASVANNF